MNDNKRHLQSFFIFALFALLFALIVCMMRPFFTVILWTALLYVLIHPFYLRVISAASRNSRRVLAKRHFFSGVFAVGTLILIIVPLTFVCVMLVQQGVSLIQAAESYVRQNYSTFMESDFTHRLFSLAGKFNVSLPDAESLKDSLLLLLQNYSARLLLLGKDIVSGAGKFVVSLLFIVFALYFCFLDGPYLVSLIKKAVPINPEYMKILTGKFSDIIKNLFAGYIMVALYQGAAAFVIMLCFKVSGALFLSVLLMFASFIPLMGAALVWLPVGVAICASGAFVKGIIFLVLSAVCISFLDNFLRPLFLKDRIQVHPLVIFFSILGGISFFGMNGLILGPLIVILFFTVLDLLVSSKKAANAEAKSPEKAEK